MNVSEREETEKLYYSISEVSEMFELNASTLRFWEKEFDLLKPVKNKKGNRIFTKKDIELIAQIVNLVKQKGFTIHGAKDQLKRKNNINSDSLTKVEAVEKLRKIKEELIRFRDSL